MKKHLKEKIRQEAIEKWVEADFHTAIDYALDAMEREEKKFVLVQVSDELVSKFKMKPKQVEKLFESLSQ